MVALKGACRNYDALWYCLARCRDVGSDYNIFFFLFLFFTCAVLFARMQLRRFPRGSSCLAWAYPAARAVE